MIASTWRRGICLAVASLGTLACVLECPGAAAQDRAPAEHAALRRPQGAENGPAIPKGSIRIVNHDSSTLVSLALSKDGLDSDTIAQNVPSGGSVVVALPNADECVYDVEASFEDWSYLTEPSFDLCKDQTLNIGENPSAPAKPTATAPSASAKTVAALHPSGEEKPPVAAKTRISIENHRHSTLLTLTLAIRGETPHLVAQIVASGATVTIALPEAGKCVYDVKGEFADNYGTSLPGYDLCKEPTLKFAE
jgi:hypothetical protein